MAAPTVVQTDTFGSTGDTTSLAGAFSNVDPDSGDLLLVAGSHDDGSGEDPQANDGSANLTRLYDGNGSNVGGSVHYKESDGTETGISYDLASAESCCHVIARITGAAAPGTDPPEFDSIVAGGATDSPDPPSVSASWGNEDTLFLVTAAHRIDITGITDADYVDANAIANSTGSPDVSAAIFGFEATAQGTDDPSALTTDAARTHAVSTVAIRPAAAGGGGLSIPVAMASYRRRMQLGIG